GHTEFILCLGYRGDVIRRFFDHEVGATRSGEVPAPDGGAPWRITFVDTGLTASVGERLKAAEGHLGDDPTFLANYSDGLADIDLHAYLDFFARQERLAAFACVRPHHSFHVVELDDSGGIVALRSAGSSGLWINGGFFIFKRALLENIAPGEDLV